MKFSASVGVMVGVMVGVLCWWFVINKLMVWTDSYTNVPGVSLVVILYLNISDLLLPLSTLGDSAHFLLPWCWC